MPYELIVVGTSWGGLSAVGRMLEHLPARWPEHAAPAGAVVDEEDRGHQSTRSSPANRSCAVGAPTPTSSAM